MHDEHSLDPASIEKAPAGKGISVEDLRAAFAGMLGPDESAADGLAANGPDDDRGVLSDESEEPLNQPAEDEPTGDADDDAVDPVSPRSIFEAMLFVGAADNSPLGGRHAAGLMRGVKPQEIEPIVGELNEQYAAAGCPYEVIGEGAGYRLALRPEYAPLRNRFYGKARETRLSQAALEVMAVVVYNQPITADALAELRGKASSSILAQLVRRKLLRLERPGKRPGKAKYFTTDRFLSLFGLESLADLPRSEDVDGQ